jgi:uncharacterized phage-associated protein
LIWWLFKMALFFFVVPIYFCKKRDSDSERSITHLKLQKLAYYAQAWHLAILKDPLFDEKIEAWVHGPVCPELYTKYKAYGFEVLKPQKQKSVNLPRNTSKLLDEVWQVYGGLSGRALENLSHKEDPWKKARKNISEYSPSNTLISNESMRKYYKELLEDNK